MKKTLVNIGLLFFSSIVSFFLLEISWRFFLFGWESFSIEKMNSVHDIGVAGVIQPSHASEIVYELKPNVRTYFKLVPFETNSHGLRDKEYTVTKPENVFRVAVIGDSFTLPAGVRIEEAYHTLLEEQFNKNAKGKTYEFINFGVGGYFLRQYWGVMQDKVSYYSPDLILIGFCSNNDHEEPPEELFNRPYKVLDQTYPFYGSFVLSGFQMFVHLTRHSYNRAPVQLRLSDSQKRYVSNIFSKMGDFSKRNSIPIVIAYLGIRPMICEELVEIAAQNNLAFVNLTLPFSGAKAKDYFIHSLDEHPNGKANRIFASQLYEYLKKTQWVRDR